MSLFFFILRFNLEYMSHSTSLEKVKILSLSGTKVRLRRIAYEIYESNYGSDELVILGIDDRGGYLAEKLKELLIEISPITVLLIKAKKVKDTAEIMVEGENISSIIKGKTVLIVDDVLYSGRTLFHAIAFVMKHEPTKIQTAVLIDRGHRSIPITHDFVGILLSTSLKQHVSVEISPESNSATAYLL